MTDPRPVSPGPVVHLVVYLPGRGAGSISLVTTDPDEARLYAKGIRGVVVALPPAVADYRFNWEAPAG